MNIYLLSLSRFSATPVVKKATASDFVSAQGCPTGCDTFSAFKAGIQSDEMAIAVLKHWATRDFNFDVWTCIRKHSARTAFNDQQRWDARPDTSYMATFARWSRDYHTIITEEATKQMAKMIAPATKQKPQLLLDVQSWVAAAENVGIHPAVRAYLGHANNNRAHYEHMMEEYVREGGLTYNKDKDAKFFELYFRLHGRIHKCVPEFLQMVNSVPKTEQPAETAHAIRIMFPGMLK